jgi:hypothetical protein
MHSAVVLNAKIFPREGIRMTTKRTVLQMHNVDPVILVLWLIPSYQVFLMHTFDYLEFTFPIIIGFICNLSSVAIQQLQVSECHDETRLAGDPTVE